MSLPCEYPASGRFFAASIVSYKRLLSLGLVVMYSGCSYQRNQPKRKSQRHFLLFIMEGFFQGCPSTDSQLTQSFDDASSHSSNMTSPYMESATFVSSGLSVYEPNIGYRFMQDNAGQPDIDNMESFTDGIEGMAHDQSLCTELYQCSAAEYAPAMSWGRLSSSSSSTDFPNQCSEQHVEKQVDTSRAEVRTCSTESKTALIAQ
jgi:hypothetical protein